MLYLNSSELIPHQFNSYFFLFRCKNKKQEQMKETVINVSVEKLLGQNFVVKLVGDRQLLVTKLDLENGFEPLKDISLVKVKTESESDDGNDDEDNVDSQSAESDSPLPGEATVVKAAKAVPAMVIKLAKCVINITPERNLMTPSVNSEKIMFLQNLLDEFAFKFEETQSQVTVSGESSVENYETFLRRLNYVIENIADVPEEKLQLIQTKKFFVSCVRADNRAETNTILVQVNLSKRAGGGDERVLASASDPSHAALKQMQKYVVAENDDDVIQESAALVGRGSGGSTADSSSKCLASFYIFLFHIHIRFICFC
jgi:hypothetical protein